MKVGQSRSTLADNAVNPSKVDPTTFPIINGSSARVAVGTSDVVLQSFSITQTGNYSLWVNIARDANSNNGAIINVTIKNGSTIIVSQSAPTVANYAGNHDTINSVMVTFPATSGDTITVNARKDRTNFASNLGCLYSLALVT